MENNMYTLCNELNDYFAENNLWADAYPHTESGINCIAVEINWGDWKHEHLRANWLVDEFLQSKGIGFHIANETVTEEDGSDCYSAIHTYRWVA